MAAHARLGGAGGLVDVDLLDGLAGGGGVAAADRVVEYLDFLDLAAAGEVAAEQRCDFVVVWAAHGGVVGEVPLDRGARRVDGEAGGVGCEVCFVAADVVDGA